MPPDRPPSPPLTSPAPSLQAAVDAYQKGARGDAERICRHRLSLGGDRFPELTLLGIIAGESGRPTEARDLLRRAATLRPDSAAAQFAYAKAMRDSGDLPGALSAYDRSLALDPRQAAAHNNRGNVLLDLGRLSEARDAFVRAVDLDRSYAIAIGNLAKALQALGEHEAAREKCEASLALLPGQAAVEVTLGNALVSLGRLEAGLAAFDRCLEADPTRADALSNRGFTLAQLGRHQDARAAFEQAIRLNPAALDSRAFLGEVLHELGLHEEALNRCAEVLSVDPQHRVARFLMGRVLRLLGDHRTALRLFDDALALYPDDKDALESRGGCLLSLSRHAEALEAFARLHELDPAHPFALGFLVHLKALCCDWEGLAPLVEETRLGVSRGEPLAEPFGWQALATEPASLQACARTFAAHHYPAVRVDLPQASPGTGKIRVGYVSGEFRHQATSILLTEILETHDKTRFEVHAFDNGTDDESELRKRIVGAVDGIVDIRTMPHRLAAAAVRERGIDILVNLNGYFGARRQEIFAMRAAPVQVNYLGFPGTLGADYMDYIVGDATVIPAEDRNFYDEKVVWLPDCYQPNDRKRAIADRRFSRGELGLPESGFVFCCFNNSYKVMPETYEVWMRIVRRVPGSVLWLLETNASATSNLRKEAARRGVAPERILFGASLDLPDHLARLQSADLFLDTLPYNAHTTGSDALWAGLPIVTCPGKTFPARVGASLLRAVGLPELVADDLSGYEELAVGLANDPRRLKPLRERLSQNRLTQPLFDSLRYTRNLERAYDAMMTRHRSGLRPDHIVIP